MTNVNFSEETLITMNNCHEFPEVLSDDELNKLSPGVEEFVVFIMNKFDIRPSKAVNIVTNAYKSAMTDAYYDNKEEAKEWIK